MAGYGIANDAGRVDAERLLGRCEEAGITSFDTAREYGDAEARLGNYFAGSRSAAGVLFMSKVKIPPDAASERDVVERMHASLERTLAHLRVEKLPVLMLHDPDVLERYGPIVTATLKRMRTDGLIDAGGVSLGVRPHEQYRRFGSLIEDDSYTVVQIPLNVMDHRLIACGAIDRMRAAGKTIVARSVFLQGLFFLEPRQLPPSLAAAAPLLEALRRLADRESVSVAQLAFSFVRDMPGIGSLVVGAEKPEQIDDNVRLLEGPRLGERTLAELYDRFAQVPEVVVTPALWNRNGGAR
jgi:aryl-alcohol dehydrogenase-like predicted oxidoreductase